MHFWPLGSRATDTSGPSSGGGGCGAQLYSRFSRGTPNLSYWAACCLNFLELHYVKSTFGNSRSLHSLEVLIAIQADDGEVAVLQQQPAIRLSVGHERKLPYRQRSNALPVRFDAAQMTAVVVAVILAFRGRDGVLGLVLPPLRQQ